MILGRIVIGSQTTWDFFCGCKVPKSLQNRWSFLSVCNAHQVIVAHGNVIRYLICESLKKQRFPLYLENHPSNSK